MAPPTQRVHMKQTMQWYPMLWLITLNTPYWRKEWAVRAVSSSSSRMAQDAAVSNSSRWPPGAAICTPVSFSRRDIRMLLFSGLYTMQARPTFGMVYILSIIMIGWLLVCMLVAARGDWEIHSYQTQLPEIEHRVQHDLYHKSGGVVIKVDSPWVKGYRLDSGDPDRPVLSSPVTLDLSRGEYSRASAEGLRTMKAGYENASALAIGSALLKDRGLALTSLALDPLLDSRLGLSEDMMEVVLDSLRTQGTCDKDEHRIFCVFQEQVHAPSIDLLGPDLHLQVHLFDSCHFQGEIQVCWGDVRVLNTSQEVTLGQRGLAQLRVSILNGTAYLQEQPNIPGQTVELLFTNRERHKYRDIYLKQELQHHVTQEDSPDSSPPYYLLAALGLAVLTLLYWRHRQKHPYVPI